MDEYGEPREGDIAGEQPLTLYIDKREVVTLMTLGTHPELLVLGYLRNQRLVPCLESVHSIQVDWETEAGAVTTFDGVGDLDEKLRHRTVTTGCGQGTVFGRITEQLERLRLPPVQPAPVPHLRAAGSAEQRERGLPARRGRPRLRPVRSRGGQRSSCSSRTWGATTPPTPSPATCG